MWKHCPQIKYGMRKMMSKWHRLGELATEWPQEKKAQQEVRDFMIPICRKLTQVE